MRCTQAPFAKRSSGSPSRESATATSRVGRDCPERRCEHAPAAPLGTADLSAVLATRAAAEVLGRRLRGAARAVSGRRVPLPFQPCLSAASLARRALPRHRRRRDGVLAALLSAQPRCALRRDNGATVVVSIYSSHLPCLLPQHGAGKKHERALALEPWQWGIVERAPWPFLRGCIRSDGCVYINRTGRYEYLAYDFCNLSEDLLGLFARVCELVGADYRRYPPRPRAVAGRRRVYSGAMRPGSVRINRRASVELFRTEVGLKA